MAMTTRELADELGTDTKTLRKFLRGHLDKENLPGQGGRYQFEKAEVAALKKAFAAAGAGEAKPKAESKKRKRKSAEDESPEVEAAGELEEEEPVAEEDEEVEDLDELLGDLDEEDLGA